MEEKKFTKEDTALSKGVAVCLLIIHHLFWNVPNIGYQINGIALSQRIGIIGKVCVSMFLILSGIGVYESSKKNFKIKEFYLKRISKLYINYIFVVLTSTIVGVMFFYKEFTATLGTGIQGLKNFILTCTGMQYIIGYQGFNGAWWFITIIIICYIVYPVIKQNVNKYGEVIILISLSLTFLYDIPTGKIKLFEIISWLFPFILGVYLAYKDIFFKIKNNIENNKTFIKKIILFLILVLMLYIRQAIPPQGGIAIKLDYFLAFMLILNLYLYKCKLKYSKKILIYLGMNSMNIYFIHMFITTYYMKNITYRLKYPIIIFTFTLLVSLLWSNILEIIKIHIKLNSRISKFQNKVLESL